MQRLRLFSLVTALVMLCSYGQAQDTKVKTKDGKTKMKSEDGKTKTKVETATPAPMPTAAMPATPAGLANTAWKGFIGDPVNDTLTYRFATDSSFVEASNGSAVVISLFTVAGDVLTINDVGGQFACPDAAGKYRFTITGDTLTFTLVEDGCEGRGGALNGTKWQRAKKPASP